MIVVNLGSLPLWPINRQVQRIPTEIIQMQNSELFTLECCSQLLGLTKQLNCSNLVNYNCRFTQLSTNYTEETEGNVWSSNSQAQFNFKTISLSYYRSYLAATGTYGLISHFVCDNTTRYQQSIISLADGKKIFHNIFFNIWYECMCCVGMLKHRGY